ncbi:hypothetical protein ACFT7U_11955 [Streptomyces rochei]|uniref:hypothetical protein n=1 Tax=Streptomyces rochei TaxID=1928 RepID=UPI0013D8FEC4|nr:hypothetical protein [Streptomyces rochei]
MFLIVFGTIAFVVAKLQDQPTRTAVIIMAIGGVIGALVPVIRILMEPPQQQPAAPAPAAAVHLVVPIPKMNEVRSS